MLCSDLAADSGSFTRRRINREHGALAIVRPDEYVVHVLPLSARVELSEFFAGNMITISP